MVKYIKQHYTYKICVSYADPYHGHIGYIYQASNWEYRGQTAKDTLLQTQDGRVYHSRAMRTTYKGELKPFAKKLNQMNIEGKLLKIEVPGKYVYVYTLDKVHHCGGLPYPKLENKNQIVTKVLDNKVADKLFD